MGSVRGKREQCPLRSTLDAIYRGWGEEQGASLALAPLVRDLASELSPASHNLQHVERLVAAVRPAKLKGWSGRPYDRTVGLAGAAPLSLLAPPSELLRARQGEPACIAPDRCLSRFPIGGYGTRGDPAGPPNGLGAGIGLGERQWYNWSQSHSNLGNAAVPHSRDDNAPEWAAIVAYYNTRLVLRSMTAWFFLVSSKIVPAA